MSSENIPVHCRCGWTGWRRPAKIKARPCPNCDGEVTRWRRLASAEKSLEAIRDNPGFYAGDSKPPLLLYIKEKEEAWRQPLLRLPNPFVLRTMTGEVQIFRIPAHCARRKPRRRDRR